MLYKNLRCKVPKICPQKQVDVFLLTFLASHGTRKFCIVNLSCPPHTKVWLSLSLPLRFTFNKMHVKKMINSPNICCNSSLDLASLHKLDNYNPTINQTQLEVQYGQSLYWCLNNAYWDWRCSTIKKEWFGNLPLSPKSFNDQILDPFCWYFPVEPELSGTRGKFFSKVAPNPHVCHDYVSKWGKCTIFCFALNVKEKIFWKKLLYKKVVWLYVCDKLVTEDTWSLTKGCKFLT